MHPGMGFRLQFTFFLTVGAVFVMWLGEQITENGIGNGASLMIFFSIVERIWPSIGSAYTYVTTGALGTFSLLVVLVILVAVVAATVYITVGARKVLIQIPQRTMARGRMREASRSYIPLRINAAGVMPIVFAQSVIVVPAAIAQFMGNQRLRDVADLFNPGTGWYYISFALLNTPSTSIRWSRGSRSRVRSSSPPSRCSRSGSRAWSTCRSCSGGRRC
jgi:preprotein translocase subunit SecY